MVFCKSVSAVSTLIGRVDTQTLIAKTEFDAKTFFLTPTRAG